VVTATALKTRIAPTPSSFLHAGNGMAFLLTARLAHSVGASLRLRIDDLDAERVRPAFIDDLFECMRWLGIEWDEGPRDRHDHERNWSQLGRLQRYQEALDLLKEQGDLYACTCTRKTLSILQRPGARRCECRSKQVPFSANEAVWRLHIPGDAVVRMEQVRGDAVFLQPGELMSDPVLRQRTSFEGGARPAYQIASLVDDMEHGITHIVRGEDLLPSTACQLYMADRLGLEPFKQVRFLHHGLVTDADGQKLSKSEGAKALRTMRAAGKTADALRVQAEEMWKAVGVLGGIH
jgi:glutamyl/glutaminyl-tRNA synthetase